MRNIALLIVGIIDILANIPYIRHTWSGKTKPNIASWSTWTLLNGIIVASAIAAGGALNTVVLAGSFFVGSSSILVLGIFKGTRKYTLFDAVCQAVALLGVVLWQLSSNPNIAMFFALMIDIFAVFPTFRHAYLHPHEETWATYCISGLMAIAITALATSFSFAALAIPIESVVVNLALTGMIIVRGQKVRAHRLQG